MLSATRRLTPIAFAFAAGVMMAPASANAACMARASIEGRRLDMAFFSHLYERLPAGVMMCPWSERGGRLNTSIYGVHSDDCPSAASAITGMKLANISQRSEPEMVRSFASCSAMLSKYPSGNSTEVYVVSLMRPNNDALALERIGFYGKFQTMLNRTGVRYEAFEDSNWTFCVQAPPGAPSPVTLLDRTSLPGASSRFSEEHLRDTSCREVIGKRFGLFRQ